MVILRKLIRRKQTLVLIGGVLAIVAICLVLLTPDTHAPADTPIQTGTSQSDQPQPAGFDKQQYSLTDPASIWVIVNKQHQINPADYAPQLAAPAVALKRNASASSMHVGAVMAPQLEALFAAAKKAGKPLRLSSGYRSYSYQTSVYASLVKAKGQAAAGRESARPGYSEHQTGLAADVSPLDGRCDLSQCFGATPEGKWLASNAYKYGFIIRYAKDKEAVTGYLYEPWHIRYVGQSLAAEMHRTGIETLEEFFGVKGGTAYK